MVSEYQQFKAIFYPGLLARCLESMILILTYLIHIILQVPCTLINDHILISTDQNIPSSHIFEQPTHIQNIIIESIHSCGYIKSNHLFPNNWCRFLFDLKYLFWFHMIHNTIILTIFLTLRYLDHHYYRLIYHLHI